MNIEEVEEPETTKIYRQNPSPSVAATRKLRKFTDETNMQARNHENSDEICAQPVRHLDLATPAFYTYRKNPKCYHTVWGKKHKKKKTQRDVWFKFDYCKFGNSKKCKFGTLGTRELGPRNLEFLGDSVSGEIFPKVSPGKILKQAHVV